MNITSSKYCVFILAFLIPFQCLSQWKKVTNAGILDGPQIRALFVSSSQELYAGIGEGIYITKDKISWKPDNQGLLNGDINAFAQIDSTIFVAAYGQILKKNLNDLTWEASIDGLPNSFVSDICTVGKRIYARAQNELYFSNDYGAQWHIVDNIPSNILSMASNDTSLFVGTDNGLFKVLEGSNWFFVDPLVIEHDASIKFISSSRSSNTIVANSDDGTIISTDGGGSWRDIGLLPSNKFRIAQVGSTIIIVDPIGVAWRSEDLGISWQNIEHLQSNYLLTRAGDVVSIGSEFFAGTLHGVYKSSDDGLTWQSNNTGLVNVRSFLNTDKNAAIVTNGNLSKATYNWGLSWSGVLFSSLLKMSTGIIGDSLFVATIENVSYSQYRGTSWFPSNNSPPGLYLESFNGSLYGYNINTVFKYFTDNWVPLTSSIRNVSTLFADKSDLFVASRFSGTERNGFFYSGDYGLTWNQMNNQLPQINSIFFDGQEVVIGTSNGVMRSLDYGKNWAITGLENTNVNTVVKNDSAIIAGHRGISITYDSGETWDDYSLGMEELDAHIEVIQIKKENTRMYALTSNGDVWMSDCITPTTPSVTSTISEGELVLTSSDSINIQWYNNGEPISGATGSSFSASGFGSFSVAKIVDGCASELSDPVSITGIREPPENIAFTIGPNPVFNELYLSINRGSSAIPFEVRILNSEGRVIREFELRKGFEVSLDTSKLKPGVYFLHLIQPNNESIQRFVKI